MLLRNLLRSTYNHVSFLRWSWFLYQYLRPFVQPIRWFSPKQRRLWLWQQSTISRRFNPQASWRQAPSVWPEVDYLVLPGPTGHIAAHIKALQNQMYPSHLLHITLPPNSKSYAGILQSFGFGSVSIQPSSTARSDSSAQPTVIRGQAEWCFICPSDCTPSSTALQSAIAAALADRSTACWQLGLGSKDKFYYYDPVTLETSTPSQSCILVNRSAIDQICTHSPDHSWPSSIFAVTQQLLAKRYTLRFLPWATCIQQDQIVPHNDKTNAITSSKNLGCPIASRSIDTPLVSVIMRTYSGRGNLLRQAMQTVFNQSYSHIELLVVQDGGDDLCSLVDSLAKSAQHQQIHFFAQERLGRSAAGNLGLRQARGQLIMFLDDDDLLMGEHIETLAMPLVCDPSLSASYAKAIEVYTSYSSKDKDYKEMAYREYPGQPKEWDYASLLQRNFIPIQSILFRHSLYMNLGGFDCRLEQLEDWNLWLRYGNGNKFKFIPKITSQFRTPANFLKRCGRHNKLIKNVQLAK
jgi:hypothetical protein